MKYIKIGVSIKRDVKMNIFQVFQYLDINEVLTVTKLLMKSLDSLDCLTILIRVSLMIILFLGLSNSLNCQNFFIKSFEPVEI